MDFNSRRFQSDAMHVQSQTAALRELALLFLKLGTIAFGGPAAHIAMMEDEVVRRRGWLSHAQFLDLLGATNLIPGPNSTEMAIHIGRMRAGWAGLLVAGACFILPAASMVVAIAWVYIKFRTLPQVGALLYGVKPVIVAIVVQALWGLGRAAMKTSFLATVALVAAGASLLGLNELMVLLGAGSIVGVSRGITSQGKKSSSFLSAVFAITAGAPLAQVGVTAGTLGVAPFSIGLLFLLFLKIGSILFGSGYVLLAFLRADLVERLGWLTEGQLLDAIAVGQITPGPIFTTATFIGYLLAGLQGALVATCGIFLPAFVFVALSGPLVPRLRQSPTAGAFLDGVNVASLALMAVVTWQLGQAALIDLTTVALAIVSAVLLFRFRLNSVWLVCGGALIGLLSFTLGWE